MQATEFRALTSILIESYLRQNELYRKLGALVQRILGQVVLSRGDLSGVMGLFEQKQQLMAAIAGERERTRQASESWQGEKAAFPQTAETERFNGVLAGTEKVIQEFLKSEEQLQRYIEHLMDASGSNADGSS